MSKELSFEDAIKRIEEIIEELSSGKAPLEKSLELYSESAKLLAFCNKALDNAKLTIEEVFAQPETDEVEE